MSRFQRLLRPRSIVTFGGGPAERLIDQCDRMGYSGDIWPVHPKREAISGRACFRDLGDVPGRFPTDQGFDEWYGVASTTDESWYRDQLQYDPDAGIQPFVQEALKDEEPTTVAPYTVGKRRPQ